MPNKNVLKKAYPLLKISFDQNLEEQVLVLLQMLELGSISEESSSSELCVWKICIDENQSEEILSELHKLSLEIFNENILKKSEVVWEEAGDWVDEYQKYLQVFEFIKTPEHSIFVDPRGTSTSEEKENTLLIKASLAFGTGSHPTTRLVGEALTKLVEEKNSFPNLLDVGCGTAILSMLGEKLGISQIIAVDNDPQALEMAQENLRLNQMINIQLFSDIKTIDKKFSLVLANILLETLIYLKEEIISKLQPKAYLILSGLLQEDETEIMKHYSSLKFIEKTQKDEWICLLFQNS